jgi:RecA/RadA recombinase
MARPVRSSATPSEQVTMRPSNITGNLVLSPLPNLKAQIERRSRRPVAEPEPEHFNPENFISTGSTLLNLALTDHPYCGWQRGKMANVIGDSSSGKTFLALTTFAEASIDKRYDDFRLIMDDAEHANEFNIQNLFGKKVASRIEPPAIVKSEDCPSELIEDFHANLRNALKEGSPFLYILDSMDALDSEADQKKIEEFMKVHARKRDAEEEVEEGKTAKVVKDAKGSYGMAKAKKNSDILRDVCGKLEKSDSILLIISQTRDNIDPMSFEKKTRSGGRALKFYATHELWTASGGKIKSKEREIGVYCIVKVSKNKITGKRREIEVPIYYDYGLDNIGSCIDFLVAEGEWVKPAKATNIDVKGAFSIKQPISRAKLIDYIEVNGIEDQLIDLTAEVWKEIEDSLKLNRKSKYV